MRVVDVVTRSHVQEQRVSLGRGALHLAHRVFHEVVVVLGLLALVHAPPDASIRALRLLRQHAVQNRADKLRPHEDRVARELVVVPPQRHHVVHAVLAVEHVDPHAVLAVVHVHDAVVAESRRRPLRVRLLGGRARREAKELLLLRVRGHVGPRVGTVRRLDRAHLLGRGEPAGVGVRRGRRRRRLLRRRGLEPIAVGSAVGFGSLVGRPALGRARALLAALGDVLPRRRVFHPVVPRRQRIRLILRVRRRRRDGLGLGRGVVPRARRAPGVGNLRPANAPVQDVAVELLDEVEVHVLARVVLVSELRRRQRSLAADARHRHATEQHERRGDGQHRGSM